VLDLVEDKLLPYVSDSINYAISTQAAAVRKDNGQNSILDMDYAC
jgi:hypothetical protein